MTGQINFEDKFRCSLSLISPLSHPFLVMRFLGKEYCSLMPYSNFLVELRGVKGIRRCQLRNPFHCPNDDPPQASSFPLKSLLIVFGSFLYLLVITLRVDLFCSRTSGFTQSQMGDNLSMMDLQSPRLRVHHPRFPFSPLLYL